MKIIKKFLRLLRLVILVTLVIFGAGFMLANRERYQDKEIRIELVEKKDDETEEDDTSEQE